MRIDTIKINYNKDRNQGFDEEKMEWGKERLYPRDTNKTKLRVNSCESLCR